MIWPFRRKRHTSSVDGPSTPVVLPPQSPDEPQAFGYKTVWWALSTTDTERVVNVIRLQNAQPANWQTGIEYAYNGFVFVTPPVYDWTLVTGFNLLPRSENARNEVMQPLLELSNTFGTALVFATHRVVEYHVWAKAVSGRFVRGYGYIGESGRTFWDEGPLTPEEKELGFTSFGERKSEAQEDSHWEREDLHIANEDIVMEIARAWSVCPDELEEYRPEKRFLGVLGTHSDLLTRDIKNTK